MADVFDQASEREVMDREAAIRHAISTSRSAVLPRTGRCHNCGEPVGSSSLFCDADCSADHELRERAKRR